MAEAPTEQPQQPTEAPTETPAPSGLPSDQPAQDSFDGFALTDEIKAKFKDGKLNGRFASIDDILEKLKEVEDFKANGIRDLKDSMTQEQQAQQAQQTQQQAINDVVPAYLDNNMELTPELEQKIADAKLDIRDIKLGAMELRDAINKAHSVVGGADNYKAMIEWGKTAMTPEQQVAFDKDVATSMGEYAIKGLYSEYQKAINEGTVAPRIEGQPVATGIRPYADRRELYRDKDYIESPQGKRDTAAQKNYKARLKATPDAVIFGY